MLLTNTQLYNAVDGRINSFREDVADSNHTIGSPQVIVAGTEYTFSIDGLSRDDVTAPAYIVDRWDSTTNTIAFPSEMGNPVYVGDLGFVFDPTVNSSGFFTIRIYINDIIPKVIRTYRQDYKGLVENANVVTTFYLGDDVGYDAKNDGVYWTIEFTAGGALYNKSATIYRT